MLSVLFAILGFLLAMVPLVVIHEFGHYWVARRLGVKILRFSVGFGKPLWMRRFGPDQTEWALSAIPLGGYVRMLGERGSENEVAPEDLPRAFNRQSPWKRILIVLAGPMANLLLAFVLYTGMLMFGVTQERPEVIDVSPASMAAKAGFEPGERVRFVGERPVLSWADVDMYLLIEALGQRSVEVTVVRPDGSEARRTLDFTHYDRHTLGPNQSRRLGFGLLPVDTEPVIGAVQPDSPAARAGLREGDRVLAIGQTPVVHWKDMASTVAANPGRELVLSVRRNDRTLTVPVVPRADQEDGQPVGRLGVMANFDFKRYEALLFTQRFSFVDASLRAWEHGGAASRLTLEMLGRMVVGQVSTKNISGPVGIATMAGQTIQAGMPFFIQFIVIMSLSLGLLNLLPIPVLDGGHLVYYLAEIVRGRPLSDRTMSMAQYLGLALLALMTLLAFYNDLHRWLPPH